MSPAILAAWATTTASAGVDTVARSAFESIRWSEGDTDETIRQMKEHNATWAVLCHPRSTSRSLATTER